MITQSVGIRSLAISFPPTVRTNNYWLQKFPELNVSKSRRCRSVDLNSHAQLDIWLQSVTPYLSDLFRGSVERRVLDLHESSLMLECRAAQDALQAAKLAADEVDLMIVASLFPDAVGPGLAAQLAQELKLSCPAWNLESTCASALVALQTAQALVQTAAYRHVLIVVSHIGSRCINEQDTLSWSMGDGAGAFVVGSVKPNQGILSSKIMPTTATCGAYVHELVIDSQGKPRLQTRTGENVSTLAETAVDCVRYCCQEAVKAAGVSLDQIDLFAFNTPTAWYASVCAKALDIQPERVINLYPLYANIGPVFSVANLYHAVSTGRICENNLVLVYANGAAATAAATVMRWGDVALGAASTEPLGMQAATPDRPAVAASCLQEKLLAVNPQQRYSILEAYLLEWLAARQLAPSQLNSQLLLTTLLDSLMAIVFRSQIELDLQVRVPMEKFCGDTTIRHLAEFLLNQWTVAELMTPASQAEREIVSL